MSNLLYTPDGGILLKDHEVGPIRKFLHEHPHEQVGYALLSLGPRGYTLLCSERTRANPVDWRYPLVHEVIRYRNEEPLTKTDLIVASAGAVPYRVLDELLFLHATSLSPRVRRRVLGVSLSVHRHPRGQGL